MSAQRAAAPTRRRRAAAAPPPAPEPPAATPPRTVRWQRLLLQGFGPYRDEVTVEFPNGLGALIAPNESGKSTLVHGLTAVLFGLRAGGAADDFAQGRFRHWHGSARFWGEVELTALDGDTWRIQRKFESHQVKLIHVADEGPVVELAGTHNPAAHRPNEAYERRLQELIGIGSREVFLTTFCVTQPLPEMETIDADVQRLLSGGGSASYGAALEALSEELAALTRDTGHRGVTARNGLKERRLDVLRREIQELDEALAAGRVAADSLQALTRELDELEGARRGLQERGAARGALRDAWKQWQEVAARYRVQVQRRSELRRALEKARARAAEGHELRASLRQRWPEMDDVPDGTGARLEQLASLTEKIEEMQEQAARVQRAWQTARRTMDEAEAALRNDYAEVRDRPHLLRDLQDLHERGPRLEELEAELGTLETEAAALEADQAMRTSYASLPRPAHATVSRLMHQSRDLMRSWRRYQELSAELEQAEAGLATYAMFEEADAELLAWLREDPLTASELEVRHETATMARLKMEDERAAVERESAELTASHGDVAVLDDGLVAAVESKVHLMEGRQRVSWEVEHGQLVAARSVTRTGLWALLAAVLGAAAGWGLTRGVPVTALMAALFAGIAAALGWIRMAQPAMEALRVQRKSQSDLEEDLREVDTYLGPLAAHSVFELGAIRQRRLEYQRRVLELERRREEVADREQSLQPEAGLSEREARLRPFTEKFGLVTIAFEQWTRLRQQRDRVAREREALCEQEWACVPQRVPGLALLDAPAPWAEQGLLARLCGPGDYAPRTVSQLCTWLEARTDAMWEQALAAARQWEEAASRLDAIAAERDRILRSNRDGRSDPERLRDSVVALRERVAPFDEHTDVDILRQLVQECQDLEAQLGAARTQCQTLEDQLGELDALLTRRRDEATPLKEGLAEVLEAAHGEVADARGRWRDFAETRAAARASEEALAGALAAVEADDLAVLEARCDAGEDSALLLCRELEALRAAWPALPDAEQALDAAATVDAAATLERDAAAMEDELDRVDERRREVTLLQARLQGREPLNVAAAEVRLAELRAQERDVAEQVEVVALAHQELKAAIEAFQAAHRERLEAASTAWFARITGRPGRRVRLDDAFRVSVLEPEGNAAAPSQLSQGAQDQLYISLRLAVAELLAGDVALPLIFDDPFHNCDAQRLATIREALATLGGTRQIVLLSHREELSGWGKPVTVTAGA